MVGIKPDEISAILKQQLSGFTSAAELEEVGTVLQVGDGIARIYGLNGVQAGELVEFETGVQGITLNLEEDNVGVVLMGPGDGIKEGSKVKRTQTIASIDVGEGYIVRPQSGFTDPANVAYNFNFTRGTLNNGTVSRAEIGHSPLRLRAGLQNESVARANTRLDSGNSARL